MRDATPVVLLLGERDSDRVTDDPPKVAIQICVICIVAAGKTFGKEYDVVIVLNASTRYA